MRPRSASVATAIAGILLALSAAADAMGDAAPQHVAGQRLQAADPVAPSVELPTDLSEWSLHCFCLGAIRTPHGAVARLDNNGELLFRARSGIRRSELEREGVPVADSQIALLQMLDVLEVDGDMLRTAFPLIGPDQLDRLRPRLRRLAESLVPAIEGDVAAIRAQLRAQGLPRSEYAVVFGHAIDGILWKLLRGHDALPSTRLNREHPLWSGAFWALYPGRGNVAGVNEHHAEGVALILIWTRPTSDALRDLDTAADLPDALRRLAAGEDPAPVADGNGRVWRLSEQGRPQVPVIRQSGDDPLHAPSLRIASAVVEMLTVDAEMSRVLDSLEGVDDRRQAIVIVAHEFIWDVMDALTEHGLVERPPVLDGIDAGTEALRDLLVVRIDADAGE